MSEFNNLVLERIFVSLYLNEYFNSELEKTNIIACLRMFFDICDFNGFLDEYEVTPDDFDKYFKPSLENKFPSTYEAINLILRLEEKSNESK